MGGVKKRESSAVASSDVVIDPEAVKKTKLRISEWTRREERERREAAEAVRRKEESNSEVGLKLTLLMWLLIIIGMMSYIYYTLQKHAPKV